MSALRWYVARALGERGTSARRRELRAPRARIAIALAFAAQASACRPAGRRASARTTTSPRASSRSRSRDAKFPARQRLAETSDLSSRSRTPATSRSRPRGHDLHRRLRRPTARSRLRSEQAGPRDPNRPVWILEQDYPKLLEPSDDRARARRGARPPAPRPRRPTPSPSAPLAPGESIDAVWRVTPVQGGTYTVHYEVAAGLDGKAKAVTADGSPVEGEFVVTISTKPPEAHGRRPTARSVIKERLARLG